MSDETTPKTPEKEEPKTPEAAAVPEVIKEGDLLKSIQAVEAKAKGKEPAKEPEPEKPEPKVEAVELAKAAGEVVKEGAPEDLKKALDVSEPFSQLVDLLGSHIDGALQDFAKALTGNRELANAMVKAIEAQGAQIEALAKTVEEYGDKPAKPASAKETTTPAGEVLKKSADKDAEETGIQPGQILKGFEHLAKNATDLAEQNRWTTALVKFESTGKFEDEDAAIAITAYRKMTGQVAEAA